MKYDLSLSIEEINTIVFALNELPRALIAKIQDSVMAQMKKPEPEAPSDNPE